MKAKELRDMTTDQLAERLVETRQELFNLRFQSATGALEDVTKLRQTRQEIARILTVQNERSLNA